VRIEQVAWEHPASESLRAAQRAEIAVRYGTWESEPGPAPTGDDITAFFVAFGDDDEPLGCGGVRQLDDTEAEVKRMFVDQVHRGTGVSTAIIRRLEQYGRERGWRRLVLETGNQQPDAVRFYTREGYESIARFGYYIDSDASLCFAKDL
jgi:putative acetyltransferase